MAAVEKMKRKKQKKKEQGRKNDTAVPENPAVKPPGKCACGIGKRGEGDPVAEIVKEKAAGGTGYHPLPSEEDSSGHGQDMSPSEEPGGGSCPDPMKPGETDSREAQLPEKEELTKRVSSPQRSRRP